MRSRSHGRPAAAAPSTCWCRTAPATGSELTWDNTGADGHTGFVRKARTYTLTATYGTNGRATGSVTVRAGKTASSVLVVDTGTVDVLVQDSPGHGVQGARVGISA